jgi:hypothetical protein
LKSIGQRTERHSLGQPSPSRQVLSLIGSTKNLNRLIQKFAKGGEYIW